MYIGDEQSDKDKYELAKEFDDFILWGWYAAKVCFR